MSINLPFPPTPDSTSKAHFGGDYVDYGNMGGSLSGPASGFNSPLPSSGGSDYSGSGIGRAASDISEVTNPSDEDYVGPDLVHRRTESPELRPADALQQPFEVAPDGQAQLHTWMGDDRRDRVAAAVALVRDSKDYVDVSALGEAAAWTAFVLQAPDDAVYLAVRAESAFATKVISIDEALSGERAEQHRAAIDAELSGQLEKHKSFRYIKLSDKPPEEGLIPLKLIMAEKTGGDASFLKAKARLVLRGDRLVPGRDYDPWATNSTCSTTRRCASCSPSAPSPAARSGAATGRRPTLTPGCPGRSTAACRRRCASSTPTAPS